MGDCRSLRIQSTGTSKMRCKYLYVFPSQTNQVFRFEPELSCVVANHAVNRVLLIVEVALRLWNIASCYPLFYQESALKGITAELKLHSNGPLYSNTVICTPAVDGWAVTFGTARRDLQGRLRPRPVPSSLYKMCNSPPNQRPVY